MKPITSPPGRNYQAMTYDTKADRVLMWGDNSDGEVDKSMWSYDFNNNTWQEYKFDEASYPAGRDYPIMSYDVEFDRTILFGGDLFEYRDTGLETWVYDYNTNTWAKIETNPVPARLSRHSMVYNIAADRVYLFGGQIGSTQFNYSNETWSYDFNTNTWTKVPPIS